MFLDFFDFGMSFQRSLPNQQFFFARLDRGRTISKPLAGRIVLQMDQTTFADQGFLWNFRKCSKDPNMDSYLSLCPCSRNQKTFKSESKPLHNFTDFKCHSFRKNPYFTGSRTMSHPDSEGACL